MSKQALKNKRRREAAKQKRMDEEGGDTGASGPASGAAPARVEFQSTGDPEKDKRVRNVMKVRRSVPSFTKIPPHTSQQGTKQRVAQLGSKSEE